MAVVYVVATADNFNGSNVRIIGVYSDRKEAETATDEYNRKDDLEHYRKYGFAESYEEDVKERG